MFYTVYYSDRTMDTNVPWTYLKILRSDPRAIGARAVPEGRERDALVLTKSGWLYESTGYLPDQEGQ